MFPFLLQDDGVDGDAGAELEPADPADRAGPPLPAPRHRLLPGRLFNRLFFKFGWLLDHFVNVQNENSSRAYTYSVG